jgi:SAM-dependent methyltransferase
MQGLSERIIESTSRLSNCCPVCKRGKTSLFMLVSNHKYLRCESCGIAYLEPSPSASELDSYYNTFFRVDRDAQARKIGRQSAPLLEMLRELLPEKGKLLEIGCSYGHFLSRARQDGWEVEGVEISREAADWGRMKFDIPILTGTLEGASAALSPPYDAIVMLHVVEHSPDPKRLVLLAKELLRPKGIVVIKTPNSLSWIARFSGRTWEWLTPPAHIYLFSPVSVRILLEGVGFQVVSISTQRGDAHNTLFEIARSVTKKIYGGRAETPSPESLPPSKRRWYRCIEDYSDLFYRPFEPLEAFYFRRRQLHPELLVAARVPD